VTDPLVLTFAELEFLLSACPQRADAVRAHLRTAEPDQGLATARAGLASLLARGLCENAAEAVITEESVTPGPEVKAVIAAFATARRHLGAAGWRGDRPEVMYLYDGDAMRLALFPVPLGRYAVEFLSPEEPLSAPLMRFVDAFADFSRGGRASALVIKSRAVVDVDLEAVEDVVAYADAAGSRVGDVPETSMALSIDAAGTWAFSDSQRSADRGLPVSREWVARRIAELLDEPRSKPEQAST
jgi:hypothetical protein